MGIKQLWPETQSLKEAYLHSLCGARSEKETSSSRSTQSQSSPTRQGLHSSFQHTCMKPFLWGGQSGLVPAPPAEKAALGLGEELLAQRPARGAGAGAATLPMLRTPGAVSDPAGPGFPHAQSAADGKSNACFTRWRGERPISSSTLDTLHGLFCQHSSISAAQRSWRLEKITPTLWGRRLRSKCRPEITPEPADRRALSLCCSRRKSKDGGRNGDSTGARPWDPGQGTQVLWTLD